MSDNDLRSRLSALRTPAAAEAARERALHRATLALAAAPATRTDGPASAHAAARRPLLPYFLSVAAALALLLGLVRLFLPQAAPDQETRPGDTTADSLRLLAQVQALFPDRLNAVIERDSTLQLDLSPSAVALIADQPVLVEFSHAGHTVRVLGFSGRNVEVELDGRRVRFAPLLTGAGAVLPSGENFAWQSELPAPAAFPGWSIRARAL